MGSLAFRSGKLGYRSNKLGINSPWVPLTMVNPQVKSGSNGWQSAQYGFNSQRYDPYMFGYEYPGTRYDLVGRALSNYNSSPWVSTTDPSARIQAAHNHGCNNPSMKTENYFMIQDCAAAFSKSVPSATVSEARLWLGNAGEIFHAINRTVVNYQEQYRIWIDRFDGYFSSSGYTTTDYMPLLNNVWLEIVISASPSIYHVIQLDRVGLAALNNQQGNTSKVDAGLGAYSYVYAGQIYINMPAQVVSMLSTYPGVTVQLYWNWNNAVLGPACAACLYAGFAASGGQMSYTEVLWYWFASPWTARTSFARLLRLEVR